MSATPSPPAGWLLRGAASLLKLAFGLLLALWLLVGLTWGAVHGFIVPRIGEWRPQLETLASRAIGVPVRIAAIEARPGGWIPAFEFQGVRLLDAQGRDALVLNRVLTAVSVTSLWRMGFEQIVLEQPELDIRRLADGRIEVAGLDLSPSRADADAPNAAADWFFSQAEWVIRSGRVRWTDDQHRQDPVVLEAVDVVVRNPGRRHLLRVDATPAGGLSGRIRLQGVFRSPFFSLHPGRLTDWSGTAHVDMPSVDLAKTITPTRLSDRLGLRVASGRGALRLWLDVQKGQLTGSTADLALTDVQAAFQQAAAPLALKRFEGRVSLAQRAQGWTVETEGLAFETQSGVRWAGGRLRAAYQPVSAPAVAPGELDLTQVDLAALRDLAASLPLPLGLQQGLADVQPSGVIDHLSLQWTGNDAGWTTYAAKGRVHGLALAPSGLAPRTGTGERTATASTGVDAGRPGVSGAAVDFSLDHHGGQAQLRMTDGHLSFPGVFEDPKIPMDRLSADLRWTVQDEAIELKATSVRFANADLEGQANATWRTSDPRTGPSRSRFPGVLALEGSLTRGRGDRVHRYLPLVIAADARAYVRDAILAGEARDVRFQVNGDLWQMPFDNPAHGSFRIAAKVSKVDYAFVPPSLLAAGAVRWPTLRQLDGDLVFDRSSMALNVSRGAVAEAAGLRVTRASARIANLSDAAVVEVSAQLDGPLADALEVIRRSPLADMTGGALTQAAATGPAGVQFGLSLPVSRMAQATVKGSVTLAGNDVQLTPDTPLLSRARGVVEFTDRGFQTGPIQARLLGGEVVLSGGLRPSDGEVQFRAQGTATAEALRQAPWLGLASALATRASGSAGYTAQWRWPKGQAQPEWSLQTNLAGVGLDWPEPLRKPASTPWPLRYSSRPVPTGEGLTLDVATPEGPLAAMNLLRDAPASGPARVLRGGVWVGKAARGPHTLPAQGFAAQVTLPTLDLDAWSRATATPTAGAAALPPVPADGLPRPVEPATLAAGALPDRLLLEVDTLQAAGQAFQAVALNAQRRLDRWQGQVNARELAGQFDYQPVLGQRGAALQARLSRLKLQTGNDDDTEGSGAAAPVPAPNTLAQPGTLPALDVTVAQLNLNGRDLGALDLQATNRSTGGGDGREWRLTRLVLKAPEAQLNATGNWATLGRAVGGRADAGSTRTALNFTLEVHDAGALLARFGMADVFKSGKGELKGQLAWLGAPYALHSPSLTGQINLDLANGQFLKAEPGLAKLLGVLSLQSLPRRLTLDFRDVFSQGFAFDFVRGDARIDNGRATTNNLQMKGTTAAVLLEGQADIVRETQDLRVLVVPELNAGTASLIATVINPAVGLGTFLAQAILRQPLIKASTQSFRIQGSWSDPQVEKLPVPDADTSAPPSRPADATATDGATPP